MQIAADSGCPDMAALVFNDGLEANGGSDATRAKLLDAIGQSAIGLRNSQGVVDGLVNPLATLIDSVSLKPDTTQCNDIAGAIGSYAEPSNDGIFLYRSEAHTCELQSLIRHDYAPLRVKTKISVTG